MTGSVRVIFESGSGNGKEKGNNKTAVNTKSGRVSKEQDISDGANERLRNYVILKTIRTAKELLLDEIQFEIGYHYDMTDNIEAKRDMVNAVSITRKVSTLALTSVMAFRFMGVAGLAFNLATSFAREGIDLYQKHKEQNTKMAQLDAQMEYTRQRVGYSLTVGDKGENR